MRTRSPLHVGWQRTLTSMVFGWWNLTFKMKKRDKQMDGHNRKHTRTLLPNCILWHPWDVGVVKVAPLKVLFESLSYPGTYLHLHHTKCIALLSAFFPAAAQYFWQKKVSPFIHDLAYFYDLNRLSWMAILFWNLQKRQLLWLLSIIFFSNRESLIFFPPFFFEPISEREGQPFDHLSPKVLFLFTFIRLGNWPSSEK